MKHRNSHFAVGYWSRLRQGRHVPDQSDIDPKALKRLLSSVFLLETTPNGRFAYRLAGTVLCDRYGSELKGRDFLIHWDKEGGPRFASLLQQSLRLGQPVCVNSVGSTDDCRMVEIETVLMPITAGHDTPERFLGIAHVMGDSPLHGHAVTFERLIHGSLIKEDDARASEPAPSSAPVNDWRSHPNAPHLRLVTSVADATPVHDDRKFRDDAFRRIMALCGATPGRRKTDNASSAD